MTPESISEWLDCGTLITTSDGKLLMGWGKRNWLERSSAHPKTPSFYFPDFFLKTPSPWFTHEHHTEIELDNLQHLLQSQNILKTTKPTWQSSDSLLFENTFKELQEQFNTKQLKKAVPYLFETTSSKMTKNQLIQSIDSALSYHRANPSYLYGFWGTDGGMLGVTPEILFQFKLAHILETMACAGTIKSDENSDKLLNSKKDLTEHLYVVDGIKESLSPFGDVTVNEMYLLKLPKLTHLVTPISLNLKMETTFSAIVSALHPTPALGAFPRLQGDTWLKSYEKKIPRTRFGAPVGYTYPNLKYASCYVAIRNVQWNQQEMSIGAGCGIIQESQCEHEWNEINLKIQATKEMLAL